MNNLKTYEGFFDFLKSRSKRNITTGDILDCLYDIYDEQRIKSDINEGNRIHSAIFHQLTDSYNRDLNKTDGLTIIGKDIATFRIQYSPDSYSSPRGYSFRAISDEEVSTILENCQNYLSGYGCKMTFFIGKGFDEGRTWETEFSDLNKMIDKTIGKVKYGSTCVRNITVKIKSSGEISTNS
jgi:hypothetical protein